MTIYYKATKGFGMTSGDGLGPARGVLFGLLIAAGFWSVVGVVVAVAVLVAT